MDLSEAVGEFQIFLPTESLECCGERLVLDLLLLLEVAAVFRRSGEGLIDEFPESVLVHEVIDDIQLQHCGFLSLLDPAGWGVISGLSLDGRGRIRGHVEGETPE